MTKKLPKTPEVFPKCRMLDLVKWEKECFAKIRKDAVRKIPRVFGNDKFASGWSCIGMEPHWLSRNDGFSAFKSAMRSRRSLPSCYHEWTRQNDLMPFINENIQVSLTRHAYLQVCDAVRQELEKTNELEVVLKALIARNVPSDRQRLFSSVIQLRDFIKRNKLEPKRKVETI